MKKFLLRDFLMFTSTDSSRKRNSSLWLAMRWRMATIPGTQQMRMTAIPAAMVSFVSSEFSGSSTIM